MATAEEGIATQIRNIEARYGKTMAQWSAIVAASGLTRHQDVVSLLKAEHGLPHGAAHRISLTARQQSTPGSATQARPPPARPAQPPPRTRSAPCTPAARPPSGRCTKR